MEREGTRLRRQGQGETTGPPLRGDGFGIFPSGLFDNRFGTGLLGTIQVFFEQFGGFSLPQCRKVTEGWQIPKIPEPEFLEEGL